MIFRYIVHRFRQQIHIPRLLIISTYWPARVELKSENITGKQSQLSSTAKIYCFGPRDDASSRPTYVERLSKDRTRPGNSVHPRGPQQSEPGFSTSSTSEHHRSQAVGVSFSAFLQLLWPIGNSSDRSPLGPARKWKAPPDSPHLAPWQPSFFYCRRVW